MMEGLVYPSQRAAVRHASESPPGAWLVFEVTLFTTAKKKYVLISRYPHIDEEDMAIRLGVPVDNIRSFIQVHPSTDGRTDHA